MFQSLFFWMLLSKPTRAFGVLLTYVRFQSLFFWMLLSKLPAAPPFPAFPMCFNPYFSGCFSLSLSRCIYVWLDLCCFNPYFSGCFSLSVLVYETLPKNVKFQSLFFWMLLSKPHPRAAHFARSGFNPYFSGCFSLSCNDVPNAHKAWNQFQSLFFWMLLSKVLSTASGCGFAAKFQSLFFWMLLSKK